MRHLKLMLVYLGVASAQSIGVGIKAGIPVTENFDAGSGGYTKSYFTSSSKTKRYTLGLSGTVYLPHRFGIEVDGLYRRLNYDWFNVSYPSGNDAGLVYDWTTAAGNRIDIPVLLRWSPIRSVYALTGPVLGIHYGFDQRRHFVQNLVLAGYSDTVTNSNEPFAHRVSKGIVFGVGIDRKAKRLHVKPEVRWTHWLDPAFDSYLYLAPATNEFEVLVGFEFGGKPLTRH
jgi:hypothetical protein